MSAIITANEAAPARGSMLRLHNSLEYNEKTPLVAPIVPAEKKEDDDANGFGHKTIGFVGGLSLLVNNITGPAMVTIPLVYQDAGWVTPTLCIITMTLLSALASSFMCEAMACIPGNENFQGRVEFSTLVDFFFGTKGLIIAQIFINLAMQSANVAAITECAQVADSTIIAIFGKSCGLRIYPSMEWECVRTQSATDSPFPDGSYYAFTIGLLVMMVLVIPMGYLNLDDNIIVQILADVFLVIVTCDFVLVFAMHGLRTASVKPFGKNQTAVLGQIMANYGYVTTVPSWCSEKKREVSVNKSLWSATIIASVTFFVLGYLGSIAFHFPKDGDILSVINTSDQANAFDKVLVYLFPLMVLATTIPVFSIIVRYNLLQSRVFHRGIANFIAVVLPWLIAIPLLTGDGLNTILNWGTLIFSSVANFIIPFLVYGKAVRFREKASIILSEKQYAILKELGLRNSDKVGTLNGAYNEKPYQALPDSMSNYSHWIAMGCAILLSLLVVMGIVLSVLSSASVITSSDS